jgi:DNA gyrase/topoisomerase IV subunit A
VDSEDLDRGRLKIFEAILAAIDRRHEVSDVVASSENADQARARVRDLLGVSQEAATEILNMQWRRLTRSEQRAMRELIEELRGRT